MRIAAEFMKNYIHDNFFRWPVSVERLRVHPDRHFSGQGQGSQLAACSESEVHSHDAVVLAEGNTTLDYRRHMETTGDNSSEMISNGFGFTQQETL